MQESSCTASAQMSDRKLRGGGWGCFEGGVDVGLCVVEIGVLARWRYLP